MSTSNISILVPTYNRANYIQECLDSLLSQTIPPFEIIVIDDGSSDNTADILKCFGNRINYIKKKNGGKPSALNLALPMVKGDYIWFFDDDDVALPDAIEKRLMLLKARPELGFVFGGHYMGRSNSQGKIVSERLYEVEKAPENEIFLKLMKGCYFTLSSVLARTSVVRTAGGFDRSLVTSEDYDMLIRLARSNQCAGVYEPIFIVRQHTGLRGSENQRYSEENRQEIFRIYDRAVGQKIRESLKLGEYLTPKIVCELHAYKKREALFSRMVVMATKGLIPEMLNDLVLALKTGELNNNLSTAERHQCSAAVCTGYAYQAIINNWQLFFAETKTITKLKSGKEAVRLLGYGFFQLAKSYPSPLSTRLRQLLSATSLLWISM